MADMRERIQKSIADNSDRLRGSTVAIYGCTVFSKLICTQLQKNDIKLSAILDNDLNKIGKKYMGVMVYKPQEYLLPADPDKIIIVCSVHEQEMIASLKNIGYGESNILRISREVQLYELSSMECLQEKMDIVRQGMGVYRHLVSGYEEGIKIFVAPKASGDVFIACSYLKEYCRKNAIKDYIIVCTGKNILDIAEIYDITCDIHIISADEEKCLLSAYMFLGDRLNIKLLAEWQLRTRNSYFPLKGDNLIFEDKFKYEIFNLDKEAEPQLPLFDDTIDNSKYNLVKGGSIIISPYAYSSPAPVIPVSVWDEIVDGLILNGYKVYTLGYGEGELPLKNTERIQFSYKESKALIEYAGGLLASRSGLCDIVRSADCRQLIIYGRNIRLPEAINIYSLQKAHKDFKGKEIVCDDYRNEDLINTVVDYFAKGDR